MIAEKYSKLHNPSFPPCMLHACCRMSRQIWPRDCRSMCIAFRGGVLTYARETINLHSGASSHSWYFVECVFESFPGWWANTVATYCPSRPSQLTKKNTRKYHEWLDALDCRLTQKWNFQKEGYISSLRLSRSLEDSRHRFTLRLTDGCPFATTGTVTPFLEWRWMDWAMLTDRGSRFRDRPPLLNLERQKKERDDDFARVRCRIYNWYLEAKSDYQIMWLFWQPYWNSKWHSSTVNMLPAQTIG